MEELLLFGKTVSDPTRLKILKLLMIQRMCVCELMAILRINQPCISQHLTILKHAQLVQRQREGRWIVYSVNQTQLNKYYRQLTTFLKKPLSKIDFMRQ